MNMRVLLVESVLALGIISSYAGESERFSLDTRRNDFVITGFDSQFCEGPYNAGGRKAYFLANARHTISIKFKVMSSSSDIVGYVYSDQPNKVVESNIYELPVGGLTPGFKLTVVGVDKDGYRTPPFRANFDVISAPVLSMMHPVKNIGRKALRYTFGEGSFTFESRKSEWKKKSYLPRKNERSRTTMGVTPAFGYAAEYTSDGTLQGWIGAGVSGDGKIQRGKGTSGAYKHDFFGFETKAMVRGSLAFSWNEAGQNFVFEDIGGVGFLDFSSGPRPVAAIGPFMVEFTMGGEVKVSVKKMAGTWNWDSALEGIGWDLNAEAPWVELGVGLGDSKFVRAEVYGHAALSWRYNGGCDFFAVDVNAGGRLRAFFFEHKCEFFEGRWQIVPTESVVERKGAFSMVDMSAASFTRCMDSIRSASVPAQVVFAKGGASSGRILMQNAPDESVSQVLCRNGVLQVVVVQDDAENREGLNVCKAALLTEDASGTLATQTIWDDGTADYNPTLSTLGEDGLVAAWMNARRVLTDEDDLSSSLSAMEIAVAVCDTNGFWSAKNLTNNSLFDGMPSLAAAANRRAVVVWRRNAKGELFAQEDSPDALVSARLVDGVWMPEEVIHADAGQIISGSLAFDGSCAVYLYERDMDFSDETKFDREIFAIRYENGAWSSPERLTNDDVADTRPQVAFDSEGRIVCVWYRDEQMVSRRLSETNFSVVSALLSDVAKPEFSLLRDANGVLAGLVSGTMVTNRMFASPEVCMSLYDDATQAWSGFVTLTENDEEERNTRAVIDDAGNVRVVYLVRPKVKSEADFGRYGTLKEIVRMPSADLAIAENGLVLDDEILVGSNAVARITVENRGLAALSLTTNVSVRLYRGDALIGETFLTNAIPSGGATCVQIPWRVAMATSNEAFVAAVDEEGWIADVNRANNVLSNVCFVTDLTVGPVLVQHLPNESYSISTTVENDGLVYSPEGATVEFRLDSPDGALLGTDTIGRVGRGEAMCYVASVVLPQSSLCVTSEHSRVFAVVNPDRKVEESCYENNISVGQLYIPFDSDGDGLGDAYERELGTDPNKSDTDGDGISDFDEVCVYGSSPTNFSYRIAFDAGVCGLLRGDVTSTIVVADVGTLPRPVAVAAKPGYRFVGWEEEVVPVTGETVYHAKYEEIVCWVDAVNGSDVNAGTNAVTAFRTLQYAVGHRGDAMKVKALDGVYEPFTCENKSIVIESVNGSRNTIIDGGGTNRCATLGTDGGQTNTVLRGFTLRNGNANGSSVSTARQYGGGVYGGTLENCVVANCEAQYGGGVCDANLANCSIVGNRAYNGANNGRVYGGGIYWKTSGLSAVDCYIADNRAHYGSSVYMADGVSGVLSRSLIVRNTALFQGTLRSANQYGLRVADCTVAENNSAPGYRAGTMYVSSVDSIIHNNDTRKGTMSSNSSYGSVTNCCTTVEGSTCIGTGIVTEPPAFVDRAGRIYDLLSPCGENIVGAGRVVDTNGQFKVTVEIDGFGVVTRPGAVVVPGSAFELVAEETGRAFEGFYTNGVFATANQALELTDIQSDIRVTARFAKRTVYVAEMGNDANDGLTYATAKRTIHAALPLVENGESIEVTPGTYAPIAPTGYASKGKSICIYSTHGAAQTAIDGGRTNRCADLSDYYSGTTNAVLRGFTLRNGYTTGSGGGAYFGTLIDCVVVGNEAVCSGGGAYLSRLENCVVARNKAGTDGGGLYSCTADRSTICGNEADGYGGGTYYGTLTNCIVYQNSAGTGDDSYGGSFNACCLSPSRGANPVLGDPLLVDGWNGDARLRVGSPCFVDGVQVCGADVGAPVEGVSVSVGVQGTGAVSNATFLVSNGDSVTIAADETERPFLYWDVDGEVVSNRVYTLTNVTADVRAVAVFDTFDWFVDARAGDDANDGFGWDTAKRTLQAAIDEAVDGETIYVEAGTYAPISTDNKRVRVESLYGAELTFLDGGGTDRCATLAIVGIQTNSVLVGFTLLNGQAQQYGGGSYGGTLDSCVISNCVTGKNVSYAYGGGAYGGALNNCLVVSNSATASYGAQGGGTYGARLRSCTIARNKAKGTSGWAQSGGVYGNGYSAYNTIIWGNEVVAPNARYPNADYANLYNCCTDDTVDRRFSGTITNDPQFVDADAGNFRLKAGSPCLNAGNNSYVQGETDLDWNDRIQDGRVDMGCYEGAAYDAPPGQVTGLCAVRGVLTWDALPDAEGYMIYRSTRRMASSAKYIGSSEANAYTDETAVEGTAYYYWVQAFNALGLGARSDLSENTWPVPLSVTTAELPEAMEKVAYAVRLEAAGGAAPYAWSCENGYVSSRTATTYAEVGTAQGWHADDNCWALALPFDFPFYGNTYRTVYVNSNGTITFGGWFSGYTYSLQNFTNRVMVAALWADLDTSGTGDIFVSERADAVTIRWMGRYQGGGEKDAVAVSATLSADGTVRLAYGAGNARGGFVGASAGEGERYLSLGDELDLNAASDLVLRDGAIGNGFALTEEGQVVGTPRMAGTNTFAVTVTDAAGETAKRELTLVVNENPNHRPVIESVSPTTNVNVKAGSLATFAVAANDPEGEPLTYVWYLDSEEVECSEAQFTFAPTVNDVGSHELRCVVSDGFWTNDVWRTWSFRVVRDWYVNAAAEEGVGDGSSADSALQNIAEAVEGALDGDAIYVAPGRYDEIIYFNGADISIVATGGAQCTSILGGCYGGDGWSPYSNNDVRQLSLDGFTMRGCELDAVTLRNCIVTSDAQSRPAYAFGCRLFDCVVTGNVCDDAILWLCELTRCTVAGNTVGEDGAVGDSSRVYDSIVWGNVTADGVTANYDDVQFENSCTWPMPLDGESAGIVTNDPRLVDAANGDMRVRIGSPCLDTDGVQTMGANVGNPVEGLVLSVRITGNGVVSPLTAVVPTGGTATFEVANGPRPFLGFATNGVFATSDAMFAWPNVTADGIVTATFSNFTFHVDAATGNDAASGLSWETPKASIQSAINAAQRGETILVKPGRYAPITTEDHASMLRIVGIGGKAVTVLDGGGVTRCAYLGDEEATDSTLIGFTITNGFSETQWTFGGDGRVVIYDGGGGGVNGGIVEDCDIVGNTSDFYGGGLAHSTARRCRIFGNRVSLSRPNDRVPMPLSGGGADSSTLVDCLVADNLVEDATEEKTLTCVGGGTHRSTLYDCTVVGNEVHGGTQAEGGGVGSGGSVYNTVVYGNRVSVASETGNVSGDNVGYVLETVNSLVGVDPLFVDAGSGDYHLATGSPCIDSGSNAFVKGDFDLDGNARIQHDTVDIGCYEYALSTPVRDAAADFAAQMAGTCHGVFVGVGEYAHASSLAGCVLDATNMQTRCVAKGYWHKTNTVAFLDASATKAAVRAQLAALAAKAVAGDTVLYYQSSHGGNHTVNGELTKDAYICLHDANYEDYEMAADLMRFAAGVKVVVVLDTCHSAGMFKTMDARRTTADMSFAQRVHQLMVARTALRKGEMSGITADDIGWIAAADYNQYSWDTAQGGAFTLALLDGWKTGEADADGDGRLNFHELWRHAKRIATGYSGADATDAQCLNEEVLLSRFAGFPDSVDADTVTVTTPVPVPHVWLDAYSGLLAASDGDYEALANAQSPGLAGTGKNWPDGTPCSVWQDFVVGTSPTNDVLFTATIRLNGTKPVIEWVPDTPALRATRVYRTFGKKTLLDADWTELTDEDSSAYRFFKVTVDLP